MAHYTLVIGNKAYSSWSLRPWLAMTHAGLAFDEVRIPLYENGHAAKIRAFSPAGKVPVLRDGATTVWDSLAICEYLAERHADKCLWPADTAARAYGRSISAEMHSGFTALRTHLPMNLRRVFPGAPANAAVAADIARVAAIWEEGVQRFGGPFLLGAFSIADAMYAPVATRFRTYTVALPAVAQRYADLLLALPAMRAWTAAAAAETEVVAQFEPQHQT